LSKKKCFICGVKDGGVKSKEIYYEHDTNKTLHYHEFCLKEIACNPTEDYKKNDDALKLLNRMQKEKENLKFGKQFLQLHCKKTD
jgi:hypothetical protein